MRGTSRQAVGELAPLEEASALLAWQETVRRARAALIEASQLSGASGAAMESRLGQVLAGMRDLESKLGG